MAFPFSHLKSKRFGIMEKGFSNGFSNNIKRINFSLIFPGANWNLQYCFKTDTKLSIKLETISGKGPLPFYFQNRSKSRIWFKEIV